MSVPALAAVEPPLSRQVAAQAAEWFVLLHSAEATANDRRAFEG